jgi:preprotein translocase subunit SecD
MRPNIGGQLRDEAVAQALQTIERRVNELGVAEPIVARTARADQILVQLPGVTDVARAKEIIRSTALLELKLVEQGPFPTEEQRLQAYGGTRCRPTWRSVGPERRHAGERPTVGLLRGPPVAAITGRDLRNARPTLDENNRRR